MEGNFKERLPLPEEMLGWMHLELNFKDVDISKGAFPQKKPEGVYKELITYLKNVVESLSKSGLINRYFFLFEPNPDLFLALEIKDVKDFESIKTKINEIEKPKFISRDFKFPTTDGDHPEGVLDFFCASTKYAFFRITDNYKTGYNNNDETKIIHCFCNQLFVNHDNERFFYLKGAKNSALWFSYTYACLRDTGFTSDIPEFLFFDSAISKFFYKDLRVYIVKQKEKEFYFTIEYYHKVNNNIVQDLSNPDRVFLDQNEAEDKAKELVDKNLTSGVWIAKPLA